MNNKGKKINIALEEIARDIFGREVGENLKTITAYSEEFGLSLGTVQKALTELINKNIIDAKKMGKHGTVIQNIDYKKLLDFLKLNYLLCVMPITYSKRYKKIMDSISKGLEIPVPIYFSHMRGGYIRLRLIEEGVYHFGVVSKLAAQNAIKEGLNLEIVEELGVGSYVTKHVILKRKDSIIKNIGIDQESNDHVYLTNLNFQKNENVKFVDIKYSDVIENLIDKKIDAAIWNYDDVLDKMVHLKKHGIEMEDICGNEGNFLATESVIVIKKNDELLKNIFKIFFNKKEFDLLD